MTVEFADTKEKILFTPGPLTTSHLVKEAMLKDVGARDQEFADLVLSIRQRLLAFAHAPAEKYSTVIVPGSGTYGVESVISSVVGVDDKLLILNNGAYGKRMEMIAKAHRINHRVLSFAEHLPTWSAELESLLKNERFTHIAVVHCETTTGILNPIENIAKLSRACEASLIVDAMSSFAGVPLNVEQCGIDFLISSSNKCIEGVPGFSFVIARKDALLKSEGKARTLGLDLFAQYRGFEFDGRFRFTPPTHAIVAFARALDLLELEGGIEVRNKRYQANHATLLREMRRLGFVCYVDERYQSPIITSFSFPTNARFCFDKLYSRLKEFGFLIYPGKLSDADCFRIGTIGHIFPHDVISLTGAIEHVLIEMSLSIPL